MAAAPGIAVPKLSEMTGDAGPTSGSVLSRGRRFAELVRIARKNGLLPWRKMDFTTAPSGASTRAIQADGLRRALEEAGGAFVKMGQLMSTRNDVLPPEFLAALSHLQQDVTPAPWADVKALLEHEMGGPLESVFSQFDPVPVAAASIAQVHRATLISGAVVAVKIQRPGVAPEVRRDVDIALRFTKAIARTSPQARALGVSAVAEQYAADLVRQLDFRLEARNLSAMRAKQPRGARGDDLRLPELYESFSTTRVLVMEFIEGETLSAVNARPGDNHRALDGAMRTVLRAFIRQIVFDGVYHADLHPGNIMISNGQAVLVDFGSVGRLDLQLRETAQELIIAYLQADTELIADGLLALAPLPPGADEKKFRAELSEFITYELGPGSRVDVATVDALIAVLTRYSMGVPASLIAAGRGFAILEGTLRTTLPEFDLLEESRALANEQISDRMTPDNLREMLTTELLGILPAVRRLPRRIDRIGGALESGSLNVNIRVLADHQDRRMLARLVRQALLTTVGLVAGVLGLVYLTTPAPEVSGVLSTATTGGALAIGSLVLLAVAAIDAIVHRRAN